MVRGSGWTLFPAAVDSYARDKYGNPPSRRAGCIQLIRSHMPSMTVCNRRVIPGFSAIHPFKAKVVALKSRHALRWWNSSEMGSSHSFTTSAIRWALITPSR